MVRMTLLTFVEPQDVVVMRIWSLTIALRRAAVSLRGAYFVESGLAAAERMPLAVASRCRSVVVATWM